jgi:hypothetical protein
LADIEAAANLFQQRVVIKHGEAELAVKVAGFPEMEIDRGRERL